MSMFIERLPLHHCVLANNRCPGVLGMDMTQLKYKVGCVFPLVIWSEFRMGSIKTITIGKTHPSLPHFSNFCEHTGSFQELAKCGENLNSILMVFVYFKFSLTQMFRFPKMIVIIPNQWNIILWRFKVGHRLHGAFKFTTLGYQKDFFITCYPIISNLSELYQGIFENFP